MENLKSWDVPVMMLQAKLLTKLQELSDWDIREDQR